MQRLADVELQLVMQGLTAQEILKLARCSRYLLHAADAPFAWRYARFCFGGNKPVLPPPTVALPRRILGWCQRILLTRKTKTLRLLRHTRVTLSWHANIDSYRGVLAIASRVPAIHEINASWYYGSYDLKHMSLVLSLPSTQHLRVLSVCDNLLPAITKAIVQLPHLHTLRLMNSSYSNVSGPDLELLYQASALTSLHFQDSPSHHHSQLVHVAACSKLRDLSVSRPWLYEFAWPVFFARPHTQQLHSLQMDRFSFYSYGPMQQDFQLTLASMHHLHRLHLARCKNVDLVLPALAHAPVLRQLTIDPLLDRYGIDIDTKNAPSALVLAALLIAAPRLQCLIDLRCTKDEHSRQCFKRIFESEAIFSTDQFTIQ